MIESVGLSGGVDPPIEIRRHEQGWWIESPNRAPASDAAVVRLMDAVDNAEVVRLIDGADRDDPTFGTGDGAIVVDLRTATGKHRSVRIGHLTNAGMTYVVREDRSPVFEVEGDVLTGLPRSIEDLGRRRVRLPRQFPGSTRPDVDDRAAAGSGTAGRTALDARGRETRADVVLAGPRIATVDGIDGLRAALKLSPPAPPAP